MPNIELLGFRNDFEAREVAHRIWTLLDRKLQPKLTDDVVITIHVGSEVSNNYGQNKPFVRVVSTDPRHQVSIAELINKELRLDVEWLLLGRFYEGSK